MTLTFPRGYFAPSPGTPPHLDWIGTTNRTRRAARALLRREGKRHTKRSTIDEYDRFLSQLSAAGQWSAVRESVENRLLATVIYRDRLSHSEEEREEHNTNAINNSPANDDDEDSNFREWQAAVNYPVLMRATLMLQLDAQFGMYDAIHAVLDDFAVENRSNHEAIYSNETLHALTDRVFIKMRNLASSPSSAPARAPRETPRTPVGKLIRVKMEQQGDRPRLLLTYLGSGGIQLRAVTLALEEEDDVAAAADPPGGGGEAPVNDVTTTTATTATRAERAAAAAGASDDWNILSLLPDGATLKNMLPFRAGESELLLVDFAESDGVERVIVLSLVDGAIVGNHTRGSKRMKREVGGEDGSSLYARAVGLLRWLVPGTAPATSTAAATVSKEDLLIGVARTNASHFSINDTIGEVMMRQQQQQRGRAKRQVPDDWDTGARRIRRDRVRWFEEDASATSTDPTPTLPSTMPSAMTTASERGDWCLRVARQMDSVGNTTVEKIVYFRMLLEHCF